MKKRSFVNMLLVALLSLLLLSSHAVAMTEFHDFGEVDWAKGIIRVIGFGAAPEGAGRAQARLLAQRAAQADAYRNAMEILEGVRLQSETTVEDFLVTSDVIRTRVEGYVRGAQFVRIDFDDFSGIAEAEMILPLGGGRDLYPVLMEEVERTTPEHPVVPKEEIRDVPVEIPHTGVIIDTRGLEVKPALFPQIFDSDGYLLYGPTLLDVDRGGDTTMVAYSRSMAGAKEMARVGDNPFDLTAISAIRSETGEITDIILDRKDADALREADLQSHILNKEAVVFIID